MPMLLEKKVIQTLIDTRKTLAVAESCTGGLLCKRLTDIPGSSKVLKFGLVAYSNEAKTRFLGVPSATIKKYGAVSKETATAMAKGARKKLKSGLAISITGIAGPGGGSPQKPVGLVYIAIFTRRKIACLRYRFKGNRRSVRSQATAKALQLLLKSAT